VQQDGRQTGSSKLDEIPHDPKFFALMIVIVMARARKHRAAVFTTEKCAARNGAPVVTTAIGKPGIE
jgi:hypothetical protein